MPGVANVAPPLAKLKLSEASRMMPSALPSGGNIAHPEVRILKPGVVK